MAREPFRLLELEGRQRMTPFSLQINVIRFQTSTHVEHGWIGLHFRAKTHIP